VRQPIDFNALPNSLPFCVLALSSPTIMDWSKLKSGDQELARRTAMRALRVYFAEKRWSRLAMTFILLLTGAAGVAASWGMLRLGLEQMWARYPLAVLIAWVAFLLLVWLWMQVERRCFTADEEIEKLLKGRDPREAMRRLKDDDSSVLDWFDAVPDIGESEGCVVIVIAVAVIGLVFLALTAILNALLAAPILFAEVFVDAILIGALYKRIKPLHEPWWVVGAMRHTFRPVALTAAALFVCALVFSFFAPNAKSIGGVLAHFRGGDKRPDPEAPLERPITPH
jgi:hypothetical protein